MRRVLNYSPMCKQILKDPHKVTRTKELAHLRCSSEVDDNKLRIFLRDLAKLYQGKFTIRRVNC